MKKYQWVSAAVLFTAAQLPCFSGTVYVQTNLVSDLSTAGATTVDSHLMNPWGMAYASTSPFWISDQGSNTATLYTGSGSKIPLTVNLPASAPPVLGPTGQVFNSAGTGNFVLGDSSSANFIFDTLAGTINGWNGGLGTSAPAVVTTSGAIYTGLAIGKVGTNNYLYAANFGPGGGGINIFNSTFAQVNGTSFAGKFVDPNLPAGYEPFNIQAIGGSLYVEYAKPTPGGAVAGTGLGYVDVYDMSGNLTQHISSSALNAPWGVTIAPAGWGQFSGDLLVGNFGNGEINAFNPATGAYIGTLDGPGGAPLVNDFLWALDFRTNGGGGSIPNGLYFDAGIGNQKDGLFGYISPSPEPAAYGLAGLGLCALGFAAYRRRAVRQ